MPAGKRGLVLGKHVPLVAGRSDHVCGDCLLVDLDLEAAFEDTGQRGVAGKVRPHGVAVGFPRDAEVVADESRHDHGGVEAARRNRDEVGSLAVEP